MCLTMRGGSTAFFLSFLVSFWNDPGNWMSSIISPVYCVNTSLFASLYATPLSIFFSSVLHPFSFIVAEWCLFVRPILLYRCIQYPCIFLLPILLAALLPFYPPALLSALPFLISDIAQYHINSEKKPWEVARATDFFMHFRIVFYLARV